MSPSNDAGEKPAIEYPCRWLYKIIGSEREEMMRAVAGAAGDKPYEVSVSRHSSTGRYISLNVEITVSGDDERINVYDGLRRSPAIKVVL